MEKVSQRVDNLDVDLFAGLVALSEEHGVIDLKGSDWRPRPGDLVRVVPNHVCVSVNLFEKLWQLRGDRIVGQWRVEARGR